jgi:transcriptional regulator with XRE-family HTH domain
MLTLGKTINILREARGLSRGAFAASVSISLPYLSLIERGLRDPSLPVLKRICKVLKIPLDVLLMVGAAGDSKMTTADPEPKVAAAAKTTAM